MKFCKNLQRVVDISDPEWAPFWTNYKMLKKLIKEIPSLGGCTGDNSADHVEASSEALKASFDTADSSTVEKDSSERGTEKTFATQQHGDHTTEAEKDTRGILEDTGGTTNQKEELGRSRGEIAFFKLLHSEFKKVSHFFERAQDEFKIREERVTEGMEIMKKPNSIMVGEKWSMLAKSIYRLYKDLLLLETFAIMTYCSFSKILKKHDKVTGHNTRAAFMSNVVNKSNFASYPKVLAMISHCEQMYEDVSSRLVKEGKEGLYEDERLFINMISRLNEQTLDSADAPDRARRSKSSPATPITARVSKEPESSEISTLRMLVEENEARNFFGVSGMKRGAAETTQSSSPDKRLKTNS